ncbi:DUF2846 domain-containing protein [Shewanella sp. SM34]|uniref:DUF2846 domain-containing protein n=1 Tax=unclassified Shewanella TaxID=196818 RepID=UPI0021DA8DDC|nr:MULTISPECIES: DUF2846 domain-containing protein [unclassified Shewanella]MCU8010422.1 DUF2846 domain-containing protein [Shewanella sp. SM87]MCU8057207.1 DUF2846 domain-containing protein [Shewanella sp. SM35]MCU8066224.1 DUF2846 domain-containing protein [Shewanella sp. SM34]
MLKKLLTPMLAIFLLLSGCATVPMASQEEDAKLKTFQKPADNKTGIYIYRNSFAGQALKKNIYINGEMIGESANKVYFYKEVEPGEKTLSTESEFSENNLKLSTEGGKNYFIEQYIKIGVFVGGAGLQSVTDGEGMKNVKECKLAK